MRFRLCLALSIALSGCTTASTHQTLTVESVLEETIQYHDPQAHWFANNNKLGIVQTRTGVADRHVALTLPPASDQFTISLSQGGVRAEGHLDGDGCSVEAGGPADSAAVALFGVMDCGALSWWRGYYSYQLSPPMNLRDGGAEIALGDTLVVFHGRKAVELKVQYGDGPLFWSYYVDSESGALLGAAFSSDGRHRDGETIRYRGEMESEGITVPESRIWINNESGEVIGTDRLLSFSSCHNAEDC